LAPRCKLKPIARRDLGYTFPPMKLKLAVVVGLAAAACSPAAAGPAHVAAPASEAPSSALTPGETEASARVTASAIDAPLRFLSDDLLEGRGPGARGDDLAIKYIAAEMEAAGLQPGASEGGVASFYQKVPLVGFTSQLPPTATFVAKSGASSPVTLAIPNDLIVGTGVQEAKVAVDAPDVVFVGYGIVAPEYQWDDYKNVDVKGKLVLVMNNDPSTDPALFEGKTRLWYGRWDYKYLEAAKHGAAGAIIIHTTPSAGYPWQVVTSSWSAGEHFDLPATPGEPRVAVRMWATEDASRKLVQLGGKDLDTLRAAAEKRDFSPVSLGVRTSLAFTNDLRRVESANVVGVLPGSDAGLAKEAVVYSAHHDHLGMHAPGGATDRGAARAAEGKTEDTIYNGAIDNASGVATVLAIARAAALSEPTKRSRVFIAVTAEEQGLLGSEFYAKHPTFPAGRIAADLNVDSANLLGRTNDVAFVGYGRSSVDHVVEAIARAQGRTVHGDAFPDRGAPYRSDQFSFAKVGIPGIFVHGGPSFVGRPAGWGEEQRKVYETLHYHQPSDEYSKDWDFAGAVQDARLLLLVGMRVANDGALPAWNAGNEFEAARKAAIAAAAAAAAH
jgi:Zn-dependent M28 family amino/carboxypeptidase